MTVDELLQAVMAMEVTDEMMDALVARLKAADERFAKEPITQEFLNREMTI
jgi:hypothetical protein